MDQTSPEAPAVKEPGTAAATGTEAEPTWETLIRDQVRDTLADQSKGIGWQMYVALRLAAKHRLEAIRRVLIRNVPLKVQMGPFAGMSFLPNVLEGCYIPKLLGCYEMELHPWWMRLRQRRNYRTIIDIGAAEGYYAVGLALMFPEARVLARDINSASKSVIERLARNNGVAERVEIGGRFAHEDFQQEARGQTLVLCDIEGDEKALLDPALAPVLARCDIVVELHDTQISELQTLMYQRFGATHEITIVEEKGRDISLPTMFDKLDSIDRMLATWEYRMNATPWAVMRARQLLPDEPAAA
jgi:precorrin-6B methylase 2